MFGKKGQGLSINVIILAAIALLVLVILSVLLLRGGGTMAEGTSCLGIGGRCASDCSELSSGTTLYGPHTSAACTNEGDTCCIKISG